MTKIGIIYGWSEGKAHGKKFRKALKSRGMSYTKNLQDADAIVVHSGGCYLIPSDLNAKLILLINYPNYKGKRISKSLREKLKSEFIEPQSMPHQLRKVLYNILYLAIRPIHHIRIRRGYKRKVIPQTTGQYLVIRNQKDSYMHPKTTLRHAKERDWNILSLPGLHDDLWLNPDRYIKIISKLLRDTNRKS